jgi:HEPN domain-containing protein
VDERSAYWLEMAEYDIETAKAMLETGRFLYVGFMCHQVIEKALKGYFVTVKREGSAIYTQPANAGSRLWVIRATYR